MRLNGPWPPDFRRIATCSLSLAHRVRKLDPSSQEGISAKMGIDATKPVEAEVMKFKRIHVKGLEELELDSVLEQDAKGRVCEGHRGV